MWAACNESTVEDKIDFVMELVAKVNKGDRPGILKETQIEDRISISIWSELGSNLG